MDDFYLTLIEQARGNVGRKNVVVPKDSQLQEFAQGSGPPSARETIEVFISRLISMIQQDVTVPNGFKRKLAQHIRALVPPMDNAAQGATSYNSTRSESPMLTPSKKPATSGTTGDWGSPGKFGWGNPRS